MTARLRVLDAGDAKDRAEWERVWRRLPKREVSARPAYVSLFGQDGDRALAALFEDEGEAGILYPFLLRRISAGQTFTDITSAYGYGGPAHWGQQRPSETAQRFWPAFDEWARSENVVSEFIRFDLFEGSHDWYPGEVVERQPNVVVRLELDEPALWAGFEHKVRKNVNRARRSGVEVVVDAEGAHLDSFLRVYRATMDRRAAAPRYYFTRDFFDRLRSDLDGHWAYFHAYLSGRIVSTELVLVSQDVVYSFLGGTLEEAYPYRPNDLLKYEIIRWAREKGKRAFVLGGGVSAGDGIERYKRAFAPGDTETFRIGRRILNVEAYDRLTADREGASSIDPDFFPAYRA
ncbi:lipid II:glycine glycyltransferase FemX [Microbacterium marinilacus]|uniref:BioF2-like acetyltransferase domain-containing protein n=1 Tax=Microbacterium marinilacus TaxID=415209 RepID=A0ABP7BDC4_9MICO|nr:GNAT family N-acetyltransferase [Microbacterium marinilacus]MBY0689441.1 GNAT family N-acetyltransferase [Microbacterium marinilacus]